MSLRIAIVGHVDHGKSTIIGRLLSDAGQVKIERQDKVRSFCESTGRKFEYAFLLDGLAEEQEKGITIDVTEVKWSWQGRDIIFVDTPGHREFIKKMVGGASRVDAAVLVIDVTQGIQPSFFRQMSILDLLGIENRVVLINKMDMVAWREEVFRKVESSIQNQNGQSRKIPTMIPTSAFLGVNLLRHEEKMSWYRGPTLAEYFQSLVDQDGDRSSSLRFLIQDVYNIGGKKIFVGRVESGILSAGQEIQIFPIGVKAKIKSIEVFGQEQTTAEKGDSIGVTLEDSLMLARGFVAATADDPPKISQCLRADIFWLDEKPLKVGDQLQVKSGTQQGIARVQEIDFELNAESFERVHECRELAEFGRVIFHFESAWIYDDVQTCETLARFVVLRDGKILGGGRWSDL